MSQASCMDPEWKLEEGRKRGAKAMVKSRRMGCNRCLKMMRVQQFAKHKRDSCPGAKLV